MPAHVPLWRRPRAAAYLAAALAALVLVPACEKDPHDAQTWIDKLDDPTELDEAVRNLERLKDPRGIKPLGALWLKMNKPSKILRAMIAIAAPDPKATPPKPAYYDDAMPFIRKAVEEFDPTDERSIDDATVACDALGKSGKPEVVPLLIATVNKEMPKLHPANRVRLSAVKALGHFKDPRAVDTLVKILLTDPDKQKIYLNAAAALAIAETGDPKALPALTEGLLKFGPLYSQMRAGITRVGKPAVEKMKAMLQEKDPDSNKIAAGLNFKEKAPGQLVFKAALLLGDLRARDAVPMMVAALKAEPKISYFDEKSGAPGPPSHMAILDGLLHIGDPSAAKAVFEYATSPKTDDWLRPKAIAVYSWLATDKSGLPQILKYVTDPNQDDSIRAEATIAYGRIASTEAEAKPIDDLIKEYDKKIAAAEAKGKKATNQADKDAAEFEKQMAEQWKFTLQETRYRIDVAIKCKSDPVCYGEALAGQDVAQGKPGLPRAERALVELYKMSEKGKPALEHMLKHSESSERLVREGILLAMPRVAPAPCNECRDRLLDVMERQASQTTLDNLNAETRVVYHYYLTGY